MSTQKKKKTERKAVEEFFWFMWKEHSHFEVHNKEYGASYLSNNYPKTNLQIRILLVTCVWEPVVMWAIRVRKHALDDYKLTKDV